jgi:hypothetical protein
MGRMARSGGSTLRKIKFSQEHAWDGRFVEYFEQRLAAQAWTEPPELTLHVCIPDNGGMVVEVAVERLSWYGARVGGAKTLKLFHFKCFFACGHR